MKYITIATLVIAVVATGAVNAFAVSGDQVAACESQYRDKNKADNAAAPEGYKVKRAKGFKAEFIASCLTK